MRDTWLSKIVSPLYYGRAFGFQRACDTFGALLGPLCAFILLQYHVPLRSIFLLSIIPGLLSIVPIIVLTHEKKEVSPKIESENLLQALKRFPTQFNNFLIIMFIFGIANFNQALLLYRSQEVMSSSLTSPMITTSWTLLLYSLFNVVRGISEFGIGTLSDYYNRKNLLALFGFGTFAITCLGCMSSTTNLWFWIMLFAFAGLSAGTVKTLEKAHAAGLLPESIRGTGFGTLQAIDGMGDLLSSIIVGSLWSVFSPQIGFIYATLLSVIAMIMLLLKKQQET
jgi:MFS family permease